MRTPEPRDSCCEALMSWAASCGESTRAGARHPLRGVKKAGNSSVPSAATVMPCAPGRPCQQLWCV